MTSVLSDHLGWHLARLKFIARFTSAGEEQVLDGMRYLQGTDAEPVEAKVVMRRIGTYSRETKDRFLILATWGTDPEEATALYRQRWEIETMFAALQSRGYRLEKTHLTAPTQKILHRVERVMGLLALAFAWTTSLESGVQAGRVRLEEGPMGGASGACFGMDWTCFGAF